MVNKILFGSMIANYSRTLLLEHYIGAVQNDNGGYDEETGEWIGNGTTSTSDQLEQAVEFQGVFLPFTDREQYESGGSITMNSRKVFTTITIPIRSRITAGNVRFEVTRKKEFGDTDEGTGVSDWYFYQIEKVGELTE